MIEFLYFLIYLGSSCVSIHIHSSRRLLEDFVEIILEEVLKDYLKRDKEQLAIQTRSPARRRFWYRILPPNLLTSKIKCMKKQVDSLNCS